MFSRFFKYNCCWSSTRCCWSYAGVLLQLEPVETRIPRLSNFPHTKKPPWLGYPGQYAWRSAEFMKIDNSYYIYIQYTHYFCCYHYILNLLLINIHLILCIYSVDDPKKINDFQNQTQPDPNTAPSFLQLALRQIQEEWPQSLLEELGVLRGARLVELKQGHP